MKTKNHGPEEMEVKIIMQNIEVSERGRISCRSGGMRAEVEAPLANEAGTGQPLGRV